MREYIWKEDDRKEEIQETWGITQRKGKRAPEQKESPPRGGL